MRGSGRSETTMGDPEAGRKGMALLEARLKSLKENGKVNK
jgi:hypothetical protein